MALKDQTKRVKQLVCRNDVIELIKESEIGKTSLLPHFGHLRSKSPKKGRELPLALFRYFRVTIILWEDLHH